MHIFLGIAAIIVLTALMIGRTRLLRSQRRPRRPGDPIEVSRALRVGWWAILLAGLGILAFEIVRGVSPRADDAAFTYTMGLVFVVVGLVGGISVLTSRVR